MRGPSTQRSSKMIRKLSVPNTAFTLFALTCSTFGVITAQTQDNGCGNLPDYSSLKAALVSAVSAASRGLNNQMWATLVDRDGVVCAVACAGASRGSQWPGSRVISAQKANTANAFRRDPGSNTNGSGQ